MTQYSSANALIPLRLRSPKPPSSSRRFGQGNFASLLRTDNICSTVAVFLSQKVYEREILRS
ncbi:MAG: hypothetical protein N2235_08300 [Fischerella sp.]|nr:hypothetical protein [Fischerella sp.]